MAGSESFAPVRINVERREIRAEMRGCSNGIICAYSCGNAIRLSCFRRLASTSPSAKLAIHISVLCRRRIDCVRLSRGIAHNEWRVTVHA